MNATACFFLPRLLYQYWSHCWCLIGIIDIRPATAPYHDSWRIAHALRLIQIALKQQVYWSLPGWVFSIVCSHYNEIALQISADSMMFKNFYLPICSIHFLKWPLDVTCSFICFFHFYSVFSQQCSVVFPLVVLRENNQTENWYTRGIISDIGKTQYRQYDWCIIHTLLE